MTELELVLFSALATREEFVLRNRTSHTLQEVGDELGISRERVRQIESKARKELVAALKKQMPTLLSDLEEALNSSALTPAEALSELADSSDEQTWGIVTRLAGGEPVRIWGVDLEGWWTRKGEDVTGLFRSLASDAPFSKLELEGRAHQIGIHRSVPTAAVLSAPESPVRQHPATGDWVRRGAVHRDAAYLWLLTEGEPREGNEIAAALDHDERATVEAIRRDDRFIQLRPAGTWALSEWESGQTKYRSAFEAVTSLLSDRGPMTYDELVRAMSLEYPVTPWRVTQCLTSDQIGRMPDGRVGLVRDGAVLVEPDKPKQPDNVAVSSDGQLVATRMVVNHDVLRGSGLPFPPFVGWLLGLHHAPSSRTFAVSDHGTTLTVARSLGLVQLSSMRALVQKLGLIDGCQFAVLLRLDDDSARVLHACEEETCPRRAG